ncbi:GNAT family protein [Amycolatopsis sp. NBC_00438]|uniref:GNAT family protein n=1 Tax=Amycolatopsis sp. NBC_00438 TaxID=2903558 RepID=UPI002E1AB7F1
MTAFGWAIVALHRIGLYVEPWHPGSVRAAENAGYLREGLLRGHREIGGIRRAMPLCATTWS